MNAIFIITALVILLYFAYPLWLKMMADRATNDGGQRKEIDGVSLVLLSYNGREYLEEKIKMLLEELKEFPRHEMIIVDDFSTDGSRDVLVKFRDMEDITVILKEGHYGIPHTMNLAVSLARYSNLVFCDQRQETSRNILRKLVEPLGQKEIGAVSACISQVDKAGCASVIRRYENYLKSGESMAGSLMGVYGPLYAMKKNCYSPIPGSIILDDLYLSLKVMATNKIIIMQECQIYDEHICDLHDYRRIRRYLTGFMQILSEKSLLAQLPRKQLTMLLWHKYLRLLIPVLLCLCYFTTGIMSLKEPFYLVPFILLTLVGIASLTPAFSRIRSMIIHFARINILYVVAMSDLLFRRPLARFDLQYKADK
jgi:poly-beta-1,6-N-acetyl-D-glucosamine synthase